MKKHKRILAGIGIIIIIALLITLMISAFISTPTGNSLFKASLYLLVLVPLMLYAYFLIYKVVKEKQTDHDEKSN